MPAAVDHFFNSFDCRSGSFLAAAHTRIDSLAPESTKAFINLIFSRFFFFPCKYLNRTNNIGLRCFCLDFFIVQPSLSFFVCVFGGFCRLDSKQALLMTSSKCWYSLVSHFLFWLLFYLFSSIKRSLWPSSYSMEGSELSEESESESCWLLARLFCSWSGGISSLLLLDLSASCFNFPLSLACKVLFAFFHFSFSS